MPIKKRIADQSASQELSKSAKKRESSALQKLGEQLARMRPAERLELPLPEELREALEMHDRLTSREAARRQRQFIGRLMRDIDPTAIEEAISRQENSKAAAALALKNAEKWREQLLEAEENQLPILWTKFENFTGCASRDIRELVERGRREKREQGETDKGVYREIFKLIAQLIQTRNQGD